MSEEQPWLGMCHLTKEEGEQQESYTVIAAVFCPDRTTYDTLLRRFLDPKGYKIVWSEEVHPAGQWVARHPKERSASDLARAVHAQNPVQFGTLKAVRKEGEEEPEEKPYLTIEEIEDVEPLDLQVGAETRKTVPEALYDPLFGQPATTESDIEKYGSADAVPPLKTYAILDAAKVQFLTSYLGRSELPYKCLFKGDSAEELKDVAPYIVQLAPDSSFTRNLFTSAGMPANMWDKSPGIYFRSRASLEDVWKHFRKFTRLQDTDKEWHFFAFWESWYSHVFAERQEKLPEFSKLFARLIEGGTALVPRPYKSTVVKVQASRDIPKDHLLLTDEIRAEMSLAILYRNMIDAAFDLHELHSDKVKEYGETPKELWPLMLDFADEVKQAGLKDPELRARMMMLGFIGYTKPWPAFIELPFWKQIKDSERNTDDLFEDFCCRLKHQNIRNGTAESIWW